MEDSPWHYTKVILDFVQWFSLTWFTLTLFRLKPKMYWAHSLYLSIVCSFTPKLAAGLIGNPDSFILLQMLITIACYWIIFRIPLLYALLMGTLGFIAMLILQVILLHAFSSITHLSAHDILENQLTYHIGIIILISATFLLAAVMKRYRLGFSFVKNSREISLHMPTNKNLLYVLLLVLFLIGLLPKSPKPEMMVSITTITLIIAVFLGVLLKLSYMKEMEED